MKDKIYGLRYDTSFKNVFGRSRFLKKLLKDIFEETIGNIQYLDKETFKQNKYLSYSICDLLIKTKNEYMIVEMQNQDLKNLEARITMYMSEIYSKQNPGKMYQNVKPVKVRLILNYSYGIGKTLKEYQELEKELLEKFGIYSDIKIFNIKEAFKKDGIEKDYALLFLLDQYSIEEAEEILEEIGKKKQFQEFVKMIRMYNANLETYEKLKREDVEQMKLEDVAAEYKREGIMEGERVGEKRGKKLEEKVGEKYNVPIGVDTVRRREPINCTQFEGIKSLKVDTNLWVL